MATDSATHVESQQATTKAAAAAAEAAEASNRETLTLVEGYRESRELYL